jgi:hypothetical protein
MEPLLFGWLDGAVFCGGRFDGQGLCDGWLHGQVLRHGRFDGQAFDGGRLDRVLVGLDGKGHGFSFAVAFEGRCTELEHFRNTYRLFESREGWLFLEEKAT